MVKYIATIEGHKVVALIDQFGVELSRFYIDGECGKPSSAVQLSSQMERSRSLNFKYDPAWTMYTTCDTQKSDLSIFP